MVTRFKTSILSSFWLQVQWSVRNTRLTARGCLQLIAMFKLELDVGHSYTNCPIVTSPFTLKTVARWKTMCIDFGWWVHEWQIYNAKIMLPHTYTSSSWRLMITIHVGLFVFYKRIVCIDTYIYMVFVDLSFMDTMAYL